MGGRRRDEGKIEEEDEEGRTVTKKSFADFFGTGNMKFWFDGNPHCKANRDWSFESEEEEEDSEDKPQARGWKDVPPSSEEEEEEEDFPAQGKEGHASEQRWRRGVR